MTDLNWLTKQPIAHRGLHNAEAGVLENTLSAAEAAIAHGYTIEADLQPSSDNEAMVFHDGEMNRLTDLDGPILGYDRSQLGKARIGSSLETIPTLSDLLDLVDGRVPLVLELKSNWHGHPSIIETVVNRLEGYCGPVAVMSFDPRLIKALGRIAPQLPRGIVADAARALVWRHLPFWQRQVIQHLLHAPISKPQFVAFDIRSLPAAAPLVLKWARGLPLLSWTVRTKPQEQKARLWTDQIIFETIAPEPT